MPVAKAKGTAMKRRRKSQSTVKLAVQQALASDLKGLTLGKEFPSNGQTVQGISNLTVHDLYAYFASKGMPVVKNGENAPTHRLTITRYQPDQQVDKAKYLVEFSLKLEKRTSK